MPMRLSNWQRKAFQYGRGGWEWSIVSTEEIFRALNILSKEFPAEAMFLNEGKSKTWEAWI